MCTVTDRCNSNDPHVHLPAGKYLLDDEPYTSTAYNSHWAYLLSVGSSIKPMVETKVAG